MGGVLATTTTTITREVVSAVRRLRGGQGDCQWLHQYPIHRFPPLHHHHHLMPCIPQAHRHLIIRIPPVHHHHPRSRLMDGALLSRLMVVVHRFPRHRHPPLLRAATVQIGPGLLPHRLRAVGVHHRRVVVEEYDPIVLPLQKTINHGCTHPLSPVNIENCS